MQLTGRTALKNLSWKYSRSLKSAGWRTEGLSTECAYVCKDVEPVVNSFLQKKVKKGPFSNDQFNCPKFILSADGEREPYLPEAMTCEERRTPAQCGEDADPSPTYTGIL